MEKLTTKKEQKTRNFFRIFFSKPQSLESFLIEKLKNCCKNFQTFHASFANQIVRFRLQIMQQRKLQCATLLYCSYRSQNQISNWPLIYQKLKFYFSDCYNYLKVVFPNKWEQKIYTIFNYVIQISAKFMAVNLLGKRCRKERQLNFLVYVLSNFTSGNAPGLFEKHPF